MQNKNQTFESVDYSLRESRLLGFGMTDSFDKRQNPVTESKIDDLNSNDQDSLEQKLAKLKDLERGKRAKESKDAIKFLREAIEEMKGVDFNDEQIENAIHDLIEKHDKEVGTAVRIEGGSWSALIGEIDSDGFNPDRNEEERFMLVHASESAVKLVLAHNKIEGDKISADQLERIFNKAGFEVESDIYEKDTIPTARPFSEVVNKDWKIAIEKQQSNPITSAEKLLEKNGTAKHEKLLDQVFDSSETVESGVTEFQMKRKMNLRDSKGTLAGSIAAKTKIRIEKVELGKFKKFGEKRAWGKIEGEDQWVALTGENGSGRNAEKLGDIQKDIASTAREFFKNPNYENRHNFSSIEFTEKVNASNLSPEQKTELIETAIKLDVTVTNRRIKESGEGRGIFLEKNAMRNANGKKDIQKIFLKKIGAGIETKGFYEVEPKASTENKGKIQEILGGESEVFMLRTDRSETNGKLFDSRVEKTRGAIWLEDLDVPKDLRQDENYKYKYAEITGAPQKTEILKKYLEKDSISRAEASQYQIAQVEIPNCENPAIVVKKVHENISLSAARYFRNTPDGWSRILRIPDWFKSDAQLNHLADPAIVSLQAETLRENEYLNARKRLEVEPHKYIEARVDGALSWHHTSLEDYIEEGDNRKMIPEMAAEYKELFKETGEGETIESFMKRQEAINKWKKKWEGEGADEQMFEFAEVLHDFDCENFEELDDKMKLEEEAFYLATILKDKGEDLEGKSVESLEDEELNKILDNHDVQDWSDAKKAIESALYDEDKINAARGPLFIGDSVFIPPTVDKKGELKLPIHESQTEITSEMINPHSYLSLAIQVGSLVSGYMTYIKTGTGRDDALGEYSDRLDDYLEEAEGSDEVKEEFKAIFEKQKSYDKFRNFVVKGQVPGEGGNVISLPLNEIQVLIPGWKMISEFCGSSSTNVKVKVDVKKPDPPCVVDQGIVAKGESSVPPVVDVVDDVIKLW